MNTEFTGRIEHSKQTIRLLYRTQRHTYEKLRMLLRMAIGAAMDVAALLAGFPFVVQFLLLLVGSWLLVSKDFPANYRADQAVDARQGSLPTIRYRFLEDGVELHDKQSMVIPYEKIDRLVEDDGYLYLFLGGASSCMVDRATVEPGSVEELKRLIAQRSGKSWERSKSFLNMNLQDFIREIRNLKH